MKLPKYIYLIEDKKITKWEVDGSAPYTGFIQIRSAKIDKDGYRTVYPFPLWRFEMTNKTMKKNRKTTISVGCDDMFLTLETAKKALKKIKKSKEVDDGPSSYNIGSQ